jgi:hypothetical protein
VALATTSHAQRGQPQPQPQPQQQQQAQEIAPWLNVAIVEVKGGHQADFEDRLREMISATAADESAPQPAVYQVVSGRPNVFHIVTPRQSMAAADTMPAPPMAPEQMARWQQRIAQTTDSVRFFVARTYPQFEIAAQPDAPEPTLLMLRTVQVIPGRQGDYETWVAQQLMPALRETNLLGHTMSNGFVGDSPQNFYHAVPLANWAAHDQNPLYEALGESGYRELMQGVAGIAQRDEIIVLRPRNDLMGQEEPGAQTAQAGQAQPAQAAARN